MRVTVFRAGKLRACSAAAEFELSWRPQLCSAVKMGDWCWPSLEILSARVAWQRQERLAKVQPFEFCYFRSLLVGSVLFAAIFSLLFVSESTADCDQRQATYWAERVELVACSPRSINQNFVVRTRRCQAQHLQTICRICHLPRCEYWLWSRGKLYFPWTQYCALLDCGLLLE